MFIYGLCEPETSDVRYIGKTIDVKSRVSSHLRERGRTRKHRWIQSLHARAMTPRVIVLEVVSDDRADDAENWWILFLRRQGYSIINHTDGGDGTPHLDQEARSRLSSSAKQVWADPVKRARQSAIAKKRWKDPLWRKKMLQALRSPACRQAISARLRGRRLSPEHIAKLPQNQKGRKLSPALIAKIVARRIGSRHTLGTIAKMRLAARRRSHLDAAKIQEIRALYANGEYSQQALADRFGVIQAHISRIVRGVSWRGLDQLL